MSFFEAGMLLCFGAAWPINILKTIQTKSGKGKSVPFSIVVIVGYICGITHKLLYSRDIVLWLYLLNLCMVTFDLALCLYYRRKEDQMAK